MLSSLREALVAAGVHGFAIFDERFEAPSVLPAGVGAGAFLEGPFKVRFARSGMELLWSIGRGSLLAMAASEGLSLPSGCRVGQCESCLLKVRSGAVAHLVPMRSLPAGTCLACVAVPGSDLVLDA